MKRYGMVIRLRPEKVEEYRRLHASVPPAVLATIERCHLRNYTIFIRELDDGRPWLFASYEHHGDDYEADMRRMAADPATQAWWRLTEPCQEPIGPRGEGAWWSTMEEIFHHP